MATKKNQTALTGSGDQVLGGEENNARLPERLCSQLLWPCDGWAETPLAPIIL